MTAPASLLGISGLQAMAHNYTREDQVFIIDGVRLDGSRFITSVSDAESIEPHRLKFEIEVGVISHWVRDGALFDYGTDNRQASGWRLKERFNL